MEQPPWGVAGIFNEAREKTVRNFTLLSACRVEAKGWSRWIQDGNHKRRKTLAWEIRLRRAQQTPGKIQEGDWIVWKKAYYLPNSRKYMGSRQWTPSTCPPWDMLMSSLLWITYFLLFSPKLQGSPQNLPPVEQKVATRQIIASLIIGGPLLFILVRNSKWLPSIYH